MSDKKLLEEGAIRRFQTLANIKPIANGLLEEASKSKKKEEEKKKPVKESYAQEEESLEEAGMSEESMEEAEGEMEAPETAAAAEGGDKGDEVRSALESIKSGVDALMGMIEGAGDLGFEVEEEPEAGGEGEMPEMSGEEESGEEGEEESLEEAKGSLAHLGKQTKGGSPYNKKAQKSNKHLAEAEAKKSQNMEEETEEESLEETVDSEALAEELTRRVAARLVKEMKASKSGGSAKHAPKPKGSPKSPKGWKALGQSSKHKA